MQTIVCFLRYCLQPISTLFPYTTLFRSPYLPGVATIIFCHLTLDSSDPRVNNGPYAQTAARASNGAHHHDGHDCRSEEHTSELQSRGHLVCRLLLEKQKYFIC